MAAASVDAFVHCASRNDVDGFIEALRDGLRTDSFANVRNALQAAGDSIGEKVGLVALRCLTKLALAEDCKRNMQAIAVLTEIGPTGKTPTATTCVQAAARDLARPGNGDLLKIAARILRAWGLSPEVEKLDDCTRSALSDTILLLAKGSGAVAAATALSIFPALLGKDDRRIVLEAVNNGSCDDIAEQLAVKLAHDEQLHLVRHRQDLQRHREAARAVHKLSLEADFPDIDFAWRSEAFASALKKARSEAVVGIAFCEPRLRAQAVEGLATCNFPALAEELASAWQLELPAKVQEDAKVQWSEIEKLHMSLSNSFAVHFVGKEADVLAARTELLAATVVGLDAEWSPAEGSPPSLLQLATADSAYLIDLPALGACEDLGNMLGDLMAARDIIKVGLDGSTDLGRIAKAYPALTRCTCAGSSLVDVRDLAAAQRMREEGVSKKQSREGLSLKSMAEKYLGKPLDKTVQMSDWARRPLSGVQTRYAALDALVPVQLYARLAPAPA